MAYGPSTWPANTRVQLVRVPWDSDYRDLESWSASEREAWFNAQRGESIIIEKASYLPYGQPVRLPLHVDVVNDYNYLRVTNDFHGTIRDYYYFIVGAEYVNPNTSMVMLQLDVWQTWQHGVTFNNCYVERSHVGIADVLGTTASGAHYGQALLNLPEGLDTGTHLPTIDQDFYNLNTADGALPALMIVSTVDLEADPGTADNPKVPMADGNGLELSGDAGCIYFMDEAPALGRILERFKNLPHVLQGIISITAIPHAIYARLETEYNLDSVSLQGVPALKSKRSATSNPMQVQALAHANFRDRFPIPGRYRHLQKFRTFPYCAIELTTFAGQTVYLEPDRIFSDDLRVKYLVTIRPTEPRLAFYVDQYGARIHTKMPDTNEAIDAGEFLNASVTIDNLPRFSVLNNTGMMYMLSNARSIAWQKDSADWSQNKATTAAQNAYDVAGMGIDASKNQSKIDQTIISRTRSVQNNASEAGSWIGAASGLSPNMSSLGQAGYGLASNQVSRDLNTNMAGIASSNSIQTGANQRSLAKDVRDANKSLADFAASGDYENAIAGINARVQDSQIVSPGMLGASGGDAMLMFHNIQGVAVRYKQVTHSVMRTIGEYWLRFGYYVQTFCRPPADLHVMSHFTYWKMRDTYVRSTGAPEDVVATIRGIFERGTTVWRNPEDIGNIDMSVNEPIRANYLTP